LWGRKDRVFLWQKTKSKNLWLQIIEPLQEKNCRRKRVGDGVKENKGRGNS